jgi:hypothetical protein
MDFTVKTARTDLRRKGGTAQQGVNRLPDIQVHRQPIAGLDLDQHVEGGR